MKRTFEHENMIITIEDTEIYAEYLNGDPVNDHDYLVAEEAAFDLMFLKGGRK